MTHSHSELRAEKSERRLDEHPYQGDLDSPSRYERWRERERECPESTGNAILRSCYLITRSDLPFKESGRASTFRSFSLRVRVSACRSLNISNPAGSFAPIQRHKNTLAAPNQPARLDSREVALFGFKSKSLMSIAHNGAARLLSCFQWTAG